MTILQMMDAKYSWHQVYEKWLYTEFSMLTTDSIHKYLMKEYEA